MVEQNQIRKELDKSRKSLLDLSTRNRLLNIPQHERARILHIVNELSDDVVRILAIDKKKFTFMHRPERSQEKAVDVVGLPNANSRQSESVEDSTTRHKNTKLQTLLAQEALQKRLLTFHLDARTAIEEQGVNTLYLTRLNNEKSYSLSPKVEFYRDNIRYLFSLELDI